MRAIIAHQKSTIILLPLTLIEDHKYTPQYKTSFYEVPEPFSRFIVNDDQFQHT